MASTPKLPPHQLAALMDLRDRLNAAPHGERRPMVEAHATAVGKSAGTVYGWLATYAGYDSGRKKRSDAGQTRLPGETLEAIAAMQREGIRANGKRTMPLAVAMNVADANGITVNVSESQISRLLRQRRMDVKSVTTARTTTELRSLHPNHVHQIDPSLCLLYYTPGGKQHLMTESKFYKNKLDAYAKVKLKCWRYVRYDHASGVVDVRYYEAEGENQAVLFDFLMWTWGKQEGRLNYGVPKLLLWDKGSANTAGAIAKFLEALEVTAITHEAGNARAKGGVENANNLVELGFESRLRFEPVHTVEELNTAAEKWQEAYNANSLPRLDTRIHREGIAPTARYALWQKIRSEQLRELPPIEVCQAYLLGREETRKVSSKLTIQYRHPQADGSQSYDVAGLAGLVAGCEVTVHPLIYGHQAVQITVPRFDGEALHYRLEPTRKFDEFGQLATAPVPGERYAAKPDTDIERAARAIDEATWGTRSREDAKKAKDRGDTPFATTTPINALAHLGDIERAQWMPRRGTAIDLAVKVVEEQPLGVMDTCKALMARGVAGDGLYPQIAARYPDGVPQAELDALVAEFTGTPGPALRAVAGG